jgi:four helix bundle protein
MAWFKSFEEIESWILARELTKDIYDISRNSRLRQDYGLKDQIQRASVSIMSNIAEGFERNNRREFIRFLNIARGSSAEVKSQLYILLDLGYVDNLTFRALYNKVTKISEAIFGLINSLKKDL